MITLTGSPSENGKAFDEMWFKFKNKTKNDNYKKKLKNKTQTVVY